MTSPESITITLDELEKVWGGAVHANRLRNYGKSLRSEMHTTGADLFDLIADKLTPPVPEPDPDRLWPIVKAATESGGERLFHRRADRAEGQGFRWFNLNGYACAWSDLYDVEIVFEGVQQP